MICERLAQIDIRSFGKSPPFGRFHHAGCPVNITSTTCHFGGVRYWFVCPMCGRRCAVLYPTKCRKCVGARYSVERESVANRRITRAIRLRQRLGQKGGGICVPLPPKPKRMRWHTYLQRCRKIKALEDNIWASQAL